MKTKWYSNFSDWTRLQVMATWRLVFEENWPDFADLLKAQAPPPSPAQVEQLERLRRELWRMHQAWNETELLARFIGPLMDQIHFTGDSYNFFLERKLEVRLEAGVLTGTVDGLVARGLDAPETPFFFLHEYKRSRQPESDPLGQLLIAMIAAQHLNAGGGPLFGCYIVGRIWSFVYLDGRTVAESQGYDASDAGELRIIWNILHETKRRIEARVALLDES